MYNHNVSCIQYFTNLLSSNNFKNQYVPLLKNLPDFCYSTYKIYLSLFLPFQWGDRNGFLMYFSILFYIVFLFDTNIHSPHRPGIILFPLVCSVK